MSRRSRMIYPWPSTRASNPRATTVVVWDSTTMAGPEMCIPGDSASRAYTGTSSKSAVCVLKSLRSPFAAGAPAGAGTDAGDGSSTGAVKVSAAGGGGSILVTTRNAAKKRGDKLPKTFQSP